MIGSIFGSVPVAGRRWAPQLVISGDVSPAEEFIVDPFLPPIATDALDPRRSVVIPNGRLVAIGSKAAVGRDTAFPYKFDFKGMPDGMGYKSWITIHNGRDTNPCGISEYKMFKNWPEHPYNQPVTYRKHALCAVPYITTYNDATGVLHTGDRISGHFGATNSTTAINPTLVGKPVKWVEKKVYTAINDTAATTANLSGATYPGITPTLIFSQSTTSGYISQLSAATLVWSTTLNMWTVTGLPGGTIAVVYSSGQSPDQIAGEVVRVENLSDMSQHDSWLRWVEDNYGAWEAGPMLTRVPMTQQVATRVAFTSGAGAVNIGQLAHYPIDFRQEITVTLTAGKYVDDSGVEQTVGATPYVLPGDGGLFQDYSQGRDYSINFLTGVIVLSSRITQPSIVTVAYNYETGYEQGKLWGAGVLNLTDGATSGALLNPEGVSTNQPQYLGLPSHLDIASVVGELRFLVY